MVFKLPVFKRVLHIFLLLSMPEVFGLSIQNKTDFFCVTNDNKPPVYIEPPQAERVKSSSSFFYDDNIWRTDNWSQVNSMKNIQPSIIDKRWEDFEVTYASYLRFTSVSSLALSAYKPRSIEFFIDDDEDLEHFHITPKTTSVWFHFLIVIKDFSTYVFQNNITENNTDNYILVKSVQDFHPIQFVMKTEEETYWKLHNLTYMTSNVITQTPISLSLHTQDASCLMLYYQLCSHCCLEVLIGGNRTQVCSENDDDILQQWKSRKILIDSTKNITLSRNTNNGNFSGLWNVDIRLCNAEYYLYEKTFNVKNGVTRSCKHLGEDNIALSQIREVSYGNTCDRGLLGSNCDISCERLQGTEKKDCQGYKICENDYCYCASGFQGEFCENNILF